MKPRAGQVAVAGAGMAGLTAALAFAERGFRIKVFERSQTLEEVGAGLQLSPNATRILDRLGVLPLLQPAAVRPQAIDIRRADSMRLLASVPLGEGAQRRWGAPYLTAHRADLQGALLAAMERHPGIELETGATVRGATFRQVGVTLTIERGGRTQEEGCDLLVGADGVRSTLRSLCAGKAASRYSGHLAWRAMAHPESGTGGRTLPTDRVTAFLHPDFHLVAYPVRAGAAVNLVAIAPSPASAESWSSDADPALLASAMKGVSPALANLVREAGPWTTWPIHEVSRDGAWSHPGGLALIGDAAHAMGPYAAQGAAMAIEDAAALAAAVAGRPDDLPAALRTYEALRRGRIERVARRGAFNRFTWHAAGPVAFVRDRVLALRSPERLAADLDWLYGYEVEEGEYGSRAVGQ